MSEKQVELYRSLEITIENFGVRVEEQTLKILEQEKSELNELLNQLKMYLSKIQASAETFNSSNPPISKSPTKVPSVAPQTFPPRLPSSLTLKSVVNYLKRLNFDVQNNRLVGGSLWVISNEDEFGQVAKYFEEKGIFCKYYPNGRSRDPNRPQYEIDLHKILDETTY